MVASENISQHAAFIKLLTDTVMSNLDNDQFSVEELSAQVGISRSHLHRKLKLLKGMSVSQFIREVRLEEAIKLLKNNVATASEIAYRVGFNSPTYFHRCFRKRYGLSPGQLKKTDNYILRSQQATSSNEEILMKKIQSLSPDIVLSNRKEWKIKTYKSIAVLPFKNLSDNKENEYFSEGITEDIIGQLAKISDLRVISRTSVMIYKNTQKTVEQISNDLNVEVVLEGSIRKSGNQIRIVAKLIDPSTHFTLWSETYDRTSTELFEVQTEVAKKIAERMQVKVRPEEQQWMSTTSVHTPRSYELYLQGRFLFNQFQKEAYYQAIDLFERSLQIDPDFAHAYAYIAGCYTGLGSWAGDLSTKEALEKGTPYLEKAFGLDEEVAINYSVLAYRKFFFEWDFKEAETAFLKALHLDWQDVVTRSNYVHFLNVTGRFKEALDYWQDGNIIDPFSLWNYAHKGVTHFFLGQPEDGIKHYEATLKAAPYHPILYDKLGWMYYNTHEYHKAISILEKEIERFGNRPPSTISYLSLAKAKCGYQNEYHLLLEELTKRFGLGEKGIAFFIALIYAGMNEAEDALKWLNIAYNHREVEMIWLKVEPQFRSLQQDPRYQNLVTQVGF